MASAKNLRDGWMMAELAEVVEFFARFDKDGNYIGSVLHEATLMNPISVPASASVTASVDLVNHAISVLNYVARVWLHWIDDPTYGHAIQRRNQEAVSKLRGFVIVLAAYRRGKRWATETRVTAEAKKVAGHVYETHGVVIEEMNERDREATE